MVCAVPVLNTKQSGVEPRAGCQWVSHSPQNRLAMAAPLPLLDEIPLGLQDLSWLGLWRSLEIPWFAGCMVSWCGESLLSLTLSAEVWVQSSFRL